MEDTYFMRIPKDIRNLCEQYLILCEYCNIFNTKSEKVCAYDVKPHCTKCCVERNCYFRFYSKVDGYNNIVIGHNASYPPLIRKESILDKYPIIPIIAIAGLIYMLSVLGPRQ